MTNAVVNYYDNYNEDSRLTRDNTRKLEFITTTTVLNKYIMGKKDILDVGAGTGIYSFYYADMGNEITATDITPKHVEIIQSNMDHNRYGNMKTDVVDATDLSRYDTESFDVVLCLGPMYHLQDIEQQKKCIRECLRVLRPNGVIALAYINRFFLIPYLFQSNPELSQDLISKIIEDGYTGSTEVERFSSTAYYHTPSEIESLLANENLEKLDHVATDGIGILMRDTINQLSEENYNLWVEAHLKTCSEPSILGYSNHGMVVCRKA